MKKTALPYMMLCLAVLALLSAGCRKNTGWKAQSSPAVSPSASEQQSAARPTSFTVSSFLHDLFGGELPADTDRIGLPVVTEPRSFDLPKGMIAGDVYGSELYYLIHETSAVYRLNLDTGETSVFTEDIGQPTRICTDSDGLYVQDFRNGKVVYYTYDGVRAGEVAVPDRSVCPGFSENSMYTASLAHYDGVLMLAGRDSIWTIEDGKTEWSETPVALMKHEQIRGAAIRTRDRIVVAVYGLTSDGIENCDLYEMDRKGNNARVLSSGTNWHTISVNENRVYEVLAWGCRLYEVTENGTVYLDSLEPLNGSGIDIALNAQISNSTLFVLWSSLEKPNSVALYPMPDEANTVRILTSEGSQRLLNRMVDAAEEVSVRYQTYADAAFFEKLSAALLSGNADFDLALVSGDTDTLTTLLRSIIKNRQYSDLYEGSALKANLDAMFPGVRAMMEVDGAFVALPLGFAEIFYGFTDSGQTAVSELPGQTWSTEDLFALADSLAGSDHQIFSNLSAQSAEILLSMAVSTVQANTNIKSDSIGDSAEAALKDLFDRLESLRDAGTLFGKNPVFRAVGRGCFYMNGVTSASEKARLALLPCVPEKHLPKNAPRPSSSASSQSGKQPLTITGFLFVNPNSERAAKALDFLTELTNEENRYDAFLFDSPLWPDLTRYYRVMERLDETDEKNPTIVVTRESVIEDKHRNYAMNLDAFLGDWYAGSELCLNAATERARDAVTGFCEGRVSGGDCAKILYEEFVYRLKG
ncbi:MAG: extracellular solute-binding protein [Ruminococcaceae bacterium]|nr:extracellular solute-binding protein [Oscillospiraceae bacterium]